jgi:hypothetical protein
MRGACHNYLGRVALNVNERRTVAHALISLVILAFPLSGIAR